MSYLKKQTELIQRLEDQFRRHHQSFVGSDLLPAIRKIVKEFEYENLDKVTLNHIHQACRAVFQEAESKDISYVLPNSLKSRPYAWNLAQMTDMQRMAAMPAPYYVAVKGIEFRFGEEPSQIAYEWDLQHLRDHSNHPFPTDWKALGAKPLTCTKDNDFYFWKEKDEDTEREYLIVASVGASRYSDDLTHRRIVWDASSDLEHEISVDEGLQVAQLCLRQLGIIPWPGGERCDSLLP